MLHFLSFPEHLILIELHFFVADLSPRYKGSARIASKKEYLYKGVKNDDRRVTLNSIKLDRGMGWEEVRSLRQIDQQPQFWINQLKSKVMMTLRSPTSSPKQKLLDTYFASTGLSVSFFATQILFVCVLLRNF